MKKAIGNIKAGDVKQTDAIIAKVLYDELPPYIRDAATMKTTMDVHTVVLTGLTDGLLEDLTAFCIDSDVPGSTGVELRMA